MNKRGNKFWRKVAILSIIFVYIVCAFIADVMYTNAYNSLLRTSYGPGEVCNVELYPRGGITDSWIKILDGKRDHVGMIYEGKITNNGKYDISAWSLRINIEDDIYLNNAWCGTVEVHQMTNEAERVQTLDLRDCKKSEITLEYRMADSDLLIPLHKGDYLIYSPNQEVNEYPVMGTGTSKGNPGTVAIGIIFYYSAGHEIDLSNVEMTYRLHKALGQDVSFWILVVIAIIWLITVIVFTAVEMNLVKMRKKMQNDEQIIGQAFNVFSQFFDAKDELTNGHSLRVAQYSKLLAEKMGMSEEECTNIYYIALMHDCGKVWIPDSILKKPGRLTDEEFNIMRKHPTNGANMLANFSSIDGIRDGALYHHERYDGKGYPTGKKENDIPLIGRLICVADSFDAMNSNRCYRERMPKASILDELKGNSGKQFDADIVRCLLELIDEGKIVFSEDIASAQQNTINQKIKR